MERNEVFYMCLESRAMIFKCFKISWSSLWASSKLLGDENCGEKNLNNK